MSKSQNSQRIPDHSSDDVSADEHKPLDPNVFSYNKYDTKRIIEHFGGSTRSVADENKFELDLSNNLTQTVFSKTKKIVIPIFIIIGILALIMMITGLISDDVGSLIALLCIITMTLVGSIIGMIGTYLWGSIEEVIDFFKVQNSKFEGNIDNLRSIRTKLRDITQSLFFEVGKLNLTAKDLEENLHEFDKLRQELSDICDQNQDLNYLLEAVNKQYDDLVNVISNNERAHLLSIYYEVSTQDREEGLSENEYQRFLGRLNKGTQKLFYQQGTFEELSGDDDIIDLNEFEQILDKVMQQQELSMQQYI